MPMTRRDVAGAFGGTVFAALLGFAAKSARADTKAEIDAAVGAAVQRLRGINNVAALMDASVAQLKRPLLSPELFPAELGYAVPEDADK